MKFEPAMSTIHCTFLNQPFNSVKLCNASITYGANCDQQLGIYSSEGTGNFVTTPTLVLEEGVNQLCFSVTAKSGNKTVIVEGTLDVVKLGNAYLNNA